MAMNITVTGVTDTEQFMDLDFGDAFLYCGLAYVKTKPANGHKGARFNAVGVGHEGIMYLWHDLVIPVNAEFTFKDKEE